MKGLIVGAVTAASAVIVVSVALAAAGGPTTTHNVQPTEVTGNVGKCPAGNRYQLNLDWDKGEVTTGVHGFIEITAVDAVNHTFDWKIVDPEAVEENVVYVKGGPNTNKYDYIGPPNIAAVDDTFLHAPENTKSKKVGDFYGLSHILFCFDSKN